MTAPAPVVLYSEVEPMGEVFIEFDQGISWVFEPTDFTVTVNGVAIPVTGYWDDPSSGRIALFTYPVNIFRSDLVSVSYDANNGTPDSIVGQASNSPVQSFALPYLWNGSMLTLLSAPSTPALDVINDTGISNSDGITNDPTTRFSGLTDPNNPWASHTLWGQYANGSFFASLTPDGSGSWEYTFIGLGDGEYDLYVESSDWFSNQSAYSNTLHMVVDTIAPAATVTAATVDIGADVTTAQSDEIGRVYLVNSLDAGSVSVLSDLDNLVAGGFAAQSDVTSTLTDVTIGTSGLQAGTYLVYAVDYAGNVSLASSDSITLRTPPVSGGYSFNYPSDSQFGDLIAVGFNDLISGDRFVTGCFDYIEGLDGNDTILGFAGNDSLIGGNGSDLIRGGLGQDYLLGGIGADTLFGGQGDDILRGARGWDVIVGDVGNDSIWGGLGADILIGGQGNDSFEFTSQLDGVFNVDTIVDFVSGNDRIELSATIFKAFSEQIGANVGLSQFITYDAATGVLSYDEDGSGSGKALAFGVLGATTHPVSIGSDFWVVA